MQYVRVSLTSGLCSPAVEGLLLAGRFSAEEFGRRLATVLGFNPCMVVEQDQKDADEPTGLFRHLPIRDGVVCRE